MGNPKIVVYDDKFTSRFLWKYLLHARFFGSTKKQARNDRVDAAVPFWAGRVQFALTQYKVAKCLWTYHRRTHL